MDGLAAQALVSERFRPSTRCEPHLNLIQVYIPNEPLLTTELLVPWAFVLW